MNTTQHNVDILILGGGIGGLSAALYGSRARLKTLVIDSQGTGGQIATTELVENYPGVKGTTGPALAQIMRDQAVEFGAEILEYVQVLEIGLQPEARRVLAQDLMGNLHEIRAKTIILAMGATYRKLGIPGEQEFYGKGVSNCATCDGKFFEGKQVAVIGGGNTALEEGHFLTRYAGVDLIHRRDKFRAEKVIQERAEASDRMSFHLNKAVEEIHGEGEGYQRKVIGVTIRDTESGDLLQLPVDGVFVFVGMLPNTGLVRGLVHLGTDNYIPTDEKMQVFAMADKNNTLWPLAGVYAVGDVRKTFLRQAITSAADGAIAAVAAEKYIESLS